MRRTNVAVALALASVVAAAGCARKELTRTRGAARSGAEMPSDESMTGHAVVQTDPMDGAMRYEVSRVDMSVGEVILVAVEAKDQEIDPQSGRELRLRFADFRRLVGKEDPTLGDAIQSLNEGGEVIVFSVGTAPPVTAEEIDRIELTRPE